MNTESLTGERACIELSWNHAGATGRVLRMADGVAAGRVELRAAGDELFIARLEVDPAFRGYGLGSESARLLRQRAETGHWRTLRAWAPPHLGLSVYFWNRMGLRPLHGEGPDGGIWFERVLR